MEGPLGVTLQDSEHGRELTALVFGPGVPTRRLQQHQLRAKRCDPRHQIIGLAPEVETPSGELHVIQQLAEDERLLYEFYRVSVQSLQSLA
jgi:hypothetical protein